MPEGSKKSTASISAIEEQDVGWPDPAAEVAETLRILTRVAAFFSASKAWADSMALRLAAVSGLTLAGALRRVAIAIVYRGRLWGLRNGGRRSCGLFEKGSQGL